jgi:hypothetical protein
MSSPTINYIGKAGDPTTQGLGRLSSQYVKSAKLQALITGILSMGQDLELLFQRIARILNPDDDINYDPGNDRVDPSSPGGPGVYPVNTEGAKGFQLQVIGQIVGVTNVVPVTITQDFTLPDSVYLRLIKLKIYRNFVKGGTIPQLLEAIQIIMPDLTTAELIQIVEIGHMTTLVAVGREVTGWEGGIFAIPSGQSNLPGAVLPRPSGVALRTFWQMAGCFGFSLSDNAGVPILTGALGFNLETDSTTGRWARSF